MINTVNGKLEDQFTRENHSALRKKYRRGGIGHEIQTEQVKRHDFRSN